MMFGGQDFMREANKRYESRRVRVVYGQFTVILENEVPESIYEDDDLLGELAQAIHGAFVDAGFEVSQVEEATLLPPWKAP